jgi:hypothetical protein
MDEGGLICAHPIRLAKASVSLVHLLIESRNWMASHFLMGTALEVNHEVLRRCSRKSALFRRRKLES